MGVLVPAAQLATRRPIRAESSLHVTKERAKRFSGMPTAKLRAGPRRLTSSQRQYRSDFPSGFVRPQLCELVSSPPGGDDCRSGFCGSNGTCFRACLNQADCPIMGNTGQPYRCENVDVTVEGIKVQEKSCIP